MNKALKLRNESCDVSVLDRVDLTLQFFLRKWSGRDFAFVSKFTWRNGTSFLLFADSYHG